MSVTKKQFAINALWKILESFSAKGISMIMSIVLVRLLSPSDYGLLALTTIFTNFSEMLLDGGFSTALIRKESVDDYDYSAVFSISSTLSVILYIILFVFAPKVAEYYSSPQLTNVLRVMGLVFFIQAFMAVRNGIINRKMQFKLLFYCNITASLVSGLIGIFFAYLDFGAWALVIHRLSQQLILTVLLFINVEWKIKWRFDWLRIKNILSFSLRLVGAGIIGYVGGSAYGIVIGKKYSVENLGFYDKGGQLPRQFSLYTFGAMSSVLLPTISSYQNDIEKMKAIIRKVSGMTGFLIIPMMTILALTSKEFIAVLFTEKWLDSVPIMQVFCLTYIAGVFSLIHTQIFYALGESKIHFHNSIIRLAVTLSSLIIFVTFFNSSMTVLAFIDALLNFFMLFVFQIETRKLIGYKFIEVFHDISKHLIASAISGIILFVFNNLVLINNMLMSLIIKVFLGIAVYLVIIKLLRAKELEDFAILFRRKAD